MTNNDTMLKKAQELLSGGASQSTTALELGISRKKLWILLNPEKYALALKYARESKAHLKYYNREKHRIRVNRYRQKKNLDRKSEV